MVVQLRMGASCAREAARRMLEMDPTAFQSRSEQRRKCMEGVQEEAFYRQWCTLLYSAVLYISIDTSPSLVSYVYLTRQLLPDLV